MRAYCEYCGNAFSAARNTRKYCSNNCKQRAYFERNGLVLNGNARTTAKASPIVKDVNTSHRSNIVKPSPGVKDVNAIKYGNAAALDDSLINTIAQRVIAILDSRMKAVDVKGADGKASRENKAAIHTDVKEITSCDDKSGDDQIGSQDRVSSEFDKNYDVKARELYHDDNFISHGDYEKGIGFSEQSHIQTVPMADDDGDSEYISDDMAEYETEGLQDEVSYSDSDVNDDKPLVDVNDVKYNWIESKFIASIEDYYSKSRVDVKDLIDDHPDCRKILEQVKYVVKNIITYSNCKIINRKNLVFILTMLTNLKQSNFMEDVIDFPYRHIIRGLAKRIRALVKSSRSEYINFKLAPPTKAQLIAIKFELNKDIADARYKLMR